MWPSRRPLRPRPRNTRGIAPHYAPSPRLSRCFEDHERNDSRWRDLWAGERLALGLGVFFSFVRGRTSCFLRYPHIIGKVNSWYSPVLYCISIGTALIVLYIGDIQDLYQHLRAISLFEDNSFLCRAQIHWQVRSREPEERRTFFCPIL